jgi:hypothetical protein
VSHTHMYAPCLGKRWVEGQFFWKKRVVRVLTALV